MNNRSVPTFSLATFSLSILIISLLSSCSTAKQGFFQDLPDNDIIHLPPIVYEERVIEPGDYLSIVFSPKEKDDEAAAFWAPTPAASGGNITNSGYQVDPNGNVELPMLGRTKVSGLTTEQLKSSLAKSAAVFLKDPLVDVRFTTFRISVIVVGSGIKELPAQKNTLLDGLAMAGDIERTGKLYDVRLFRDYNGQRTIYNIDLRKKEVLTNPEIFQLRHNDVIYVKTRPSTIYREDVRFYTSIFSFVVGIVTLGFTIANNN